MHAHLPAAQRAMLLSIIIGAAIGLALSPVCRIRQVLVLGPTEAIAMEVASGLELPPGANTVFLPLAQIRARADDCYRVKRLTVKRRSPRAIVIRVHERQPMAALATDGSGYTVIDDEGIPLVRTDSPGPLPVAEGVVAQRPDLGSAIPTELLEPLQTCIKAAREVGIDQGLRLDFSNPYLTTLQTGDGVVGKLGDVRDLHRKIVIFGRLLEGLNGGAGAQIEYIDVSVEGKPTFRRRVGG